MMSGARSTPAASVQALTELGKTLGYLATAGLVTNRTSSRINLTGSPASLRLEGPRVGLYSTYINGPFAADLVGKFDFLNPNEDLAGLGLPKGSIGVTNAGLSGNIQYNNKFGAS
jgi:hypothetical protein